MKSDKGRRETIIRMPIQKIYPKIKLHTDKLISYYLHLSVICLPVLGFQTLLKLLLTEHSMLPPQGLLKAWLGLQCLLVTQHRVVVFPKHLVRQQ